MIAAEKTVMRNVVRKMNEINIPNQRPNIEYNISNEFKVSEPIVIPRKQQMRVASTMDTGNISPSPTDGFLSNLKQRLNGYY
jgi:hypothetical protein